jgi:predicted outer membrane protein
LLFEVLVKNKLIRLAELIQEDFPENIMASFRSNEKSSLAQRLAITSEAIAFHQKRSEALWLKAGRQRTPEEKRAAARAELAAFVFAYLTGDVKEYAESAIEALRTLNRQGDTDIVKSLAKR